MSIKRVSDARDKKADQESVWGGGWREREKQGSSIKKTPAPTHTHTHNILDVTAQVLIRRKHHPSTKKNLRAAVAGSEGKMADAGPEALEWYPQVDKGVTSPCRRNGRRSAPFTCVQVQDGCDMWD